MQIIAFASREQGHRLPGALLQLTDSDQRIRRRGATLIERCPVPSGYCAGCPANIESTNARMYSASAICGLISSDMPSK